jgi:hypothetical protein
MHYADNMTITSESDRTPDTGRWTSQAYQVQFARVEEVPRIQPDATDPDYMESPFHMSAWGISKGLYSLLEGYTPREIYDATGWLTTMQNHLVVDALEQMKYDAYYDGQHMPPLEYLFIAIDAELYLPRGLKMHVTCVTNIVPHSDKSDELDKFVAVLDPGEAKSYILERKANYRPPQEPIH